MKRITCVIDNHAQEKSSLQAEHGLSFWIETEDGNLLFDTGQTAAALERNLSLLGINLRDARSLALSHAHYDHTGGLAFALEQNPGLSIYANADLRRERYARREGEYVQIGLDVALKLKLQHTDLHLDDEAQEIFPDVWTTGVIARRPHPEGRSAHHFIRAAKAWLPDPYADDLSIVIQHAEGLALLCGCCHAGLLNTLLHVERCFSGQITHILGGTHLKPASAAELDEVVEILRRDYPDTALYLNHCTGDDAQAYLERALGERVLPFPAGAILRLR